MVKNHTQGAQLTLIGKEVRVGQLGGINSLDVQKTSEKANSRLVILCSDFGHSS
jgi:hypothetical protein